MASPATVRTLQDAQLTATFALPTQVGEANGKLSSAIDLGSPANRPEGINVELYIPTLNATMAPAASTAGVAYEIICSTSSTLNSTARRMQKITAGSASGVAETTMRFRIPPDAERYIGGKVWLGTTCTDASAVTATFRLVA